MRPFKITDLLWIRPIAEKFNEWPDLLWGLERAVSAIVEEPYAIGVLYLDSHGLGLAGITGEEGIKPFIKISLYLKADAEVRQLALHAHWEEGSWQERLGLRHGFIRNAEGYYVLKENGQ